MPSPLDELRQQISGSYLQQVSRQVGADEAQTRRALDAALPTILDGLAKNARDPKARAALEQALDKDHDGSVLDDLGDYFNNPKSDEGAAIMKHVFGERRGQIESRLGGKLGLSTGSTAQLLAVLAPLLMGILGKAKRGGGGGGASAGGTDWTQILRGGLGGLGGKAGCLAAVLPLLGRLLKR
ncbi:MAG: DUF937 domain-containing protein [Planctomycetota bacterium]